jgi:hypothetical protein
VSPNLVEDPLQDVFGVISANEPLQVAEHRCSQGGIDLTDRALSIDRELGSEIDAGLIHWRLYRLPPCGAATAAAHNRPSRTITLLLPAPREVLLPSALRLLAWTDHGAGPASRAVAGRPYREDADRYLETTS